MLAQKPHTFSQESPRFQLRLYEGINPAKEPCYVSQNAPDILQEAHVPKHVYMKIYIPQRSSLS